MMAALFYPERRTEALKNFAVDSVQLAQINANSMVKEKLVTFLEADLALRKAVREYRLLPKLTRLSRFSKVRRKAEESLGQMQKALAEAHRELEMIRKLALPDNSLLVQQPYEFTLSK